MEGKPDWLPGFPVQIYCNRSVVQNGSAALDIQPRRHYVVNKVAAGQAYCRCKYILLYLHLKWGLHRIWDCPFFEIDPADSNSKRVIR